MGRQKHFIQIGQRFGRLMVIGDEWVPRGNSSRRRLIKCRCDCGSVKSVSSYDLDVGKVVSCGCWSAERASIQFSTLKGTRGYSRHPLYQTWHAMLKRCNNPNSILYKNYGARGIRVAPEWEDFSVFLAYISENLGDRPDRCTLDRIDNDGNYEPGNIRWASQSVQNYNRAPMGSRKKVAT